MSWRTNALTKQIGIACVAVFVLAQAKILAAVDWKQLSSDHFIIHFTDDETMAQDILEKAERYYTGIAQDLNYPRYSEFWTWEKKVKINLYPDHESFLQATGQPKWSQGMADYTHKQIVGFTGSRGFLDSILPHEMAHLIFRDFIGFKSAVPLWIDEGVAQWSELTRRREVRALAKELLDKNALLSIEDMMKLEIRNIKYKDALYIRSTKTKEGKDGVLFLTADNLIATYYLQAVSLIDFLIEDFGAENFAHFCRQLRDGKSLEEALGFVYSTYFRGLDEFEQAWRRYIIEKT